MIGATHDDMDPMHQHMVRQVQQIGELERETERLGNLLRQVRHELRMREIELSHWRKRAVRAEGQKN